MNVVVQGHERQMCSTIISYELRIGLCDLRLVYLDPAFLTRLVVHLWHGICMGYTRGDFGVRHTDVGWVSKCADDLRKE